jgi:uncharacterized protein (DUF2235 family)
LNENVREVYCFLSNNYEEGDQIFLFGFSRGAYIARAVAGLIGTLGLLGKKSMEQFPEIYKHYKLRTATNTEAWNQYFRDAELAKLQIPGVTIKVLGCWDTVGSLGLPEYSIVKQFGWNDGHKFHDTNLSSCEFCSLRRSGVR